MLHLGPIALWLFGSCGPGVRLFGITFAFFDHALFVGLTFIDIKKRNAAGALVHH